MRPAARLVAVSSAGLVCVGALAGTAGAATVTTPAPFGAQTTASGVEVRLDLTGVPGVSSLPDLSALGLDLSIPNTLDLINAAGAASRGSGASGSTANTAALGGTLAKLIVLNTLDRTVTSSVSAPGPSTTSALSIPETDGLGPIAVNPLKAATDASTLSNSGSGGLASLNALSLGDIIGSLPVSLTSELNTAASTISGALSTLTGELTTILGTVLPSELSTITTELKNLSTTLDNLPTTLLDEPLIQLSGVDVSQSITHTASGVSATAHASLAGLSLLGGLVTLGGFDNSVTASADGTPGSATANPQPNVAAAKVGNLTDIVLGSSGLEADLGALDGLVPPSVVTSLNSAVNTVVSTLNSVLSALGVSIVPAAYTESAAANGTAASASSSGLAITVSPPGVSPSSANAAADPADALLLVRVGAADASVTSGVATTKTTTPPTKTTTPSTPPKLAYTGADLPLTGGIALLVLASGVLLRRRRRAEH